MPANVPPSRHDAGLPTRLANGEANGDARGALCRRRREAASARSSEAPNEPVGAESDEPAEIPDADAPAEDGPAPSED